MSRFVGSGTVKAMGPAARVGMGLTCGVGIGFEGNIVEVEVGGTIIVTCSRGGPGHGTLRRARTSKQAGKALRSQGYPYALVM